ncbi:Glycosyltransferase involved in cell wall bisynthesis [Dyella sp. OK004]|uniref:glycosyltransferase family 4 protein n=1 Tax=Dyella sp. OK004 TaxID=1855292 RepID=UPI0008F41D23|nr:glycosyltransferase family 4 protein [Dyella sp. OK004]SFS19928.1 Glycosyltransferase involved in cell wall bisynthesis [Dyella sp. OK004]
MHVAQINFLPSPKGQRLAETLEQWPSLADIAELVAGSGTRVSVVQVAAHAERLTRAGVDYHAIDCTCDRGHRGKRVAGLLDEIQADVLHVHGLGFAEDIYTVSQHLPRRPVLLQDHADRVPGYWHRRQWRRWYAVASGVAFTAPVLAQPFVRAGMFAPSARVFAIPESSCRFTPGSRAEACAETGLNGSPSVLWVGHLSEGKDPLTVLDGIALAAERLPGLQLWCAFATSPLLGAVQRRIATDPRLAGRVHLLGKVAHARVESLMRASDLFVSGSLAESCSYAVLEAMACGVTPVITDIPSHRALASGIGALWPCGDAHALAEALVRMAADHTSSEQVRAHFDANLSFAAVGRQWKSAYAQLLDHQYRVAP